MGYAEEYSTVGATAQIAQVDNRLEWVVNDGGVDVRGSEEIGEDGLQAALARTRRAIDARFEGAGQHGVSTPVNTPPVDTPDDTPVTE